MVDIDKDTNMKNTIVENQNPQVDPLEDQTVEMEEGKKVELQIDENNLVMSQDIDVFEEFLAGDSTREEKWTSVQASAKRKGMLLTEALKRAPKWNEGDKAEILNWLEEMCNKSSSDLGVGTEAEISANTKFAIKLFESLLRSDQYSIIQRSVVVDPFKGENARRAGLELQLARSSINYFKAMRKAAPKDFVRLLFSKPHIIPHCCYHMIYWREWLLHKTPSVSSTESTNVTKQSITKMKTLFPAKRLKTLQFGQVNNFQIAENRNGSMLSELGLKQRMEGPKPLLRKAPTRNTSSLIDSTTGNKAKPARTSKVSFSETPAQKQQAMTRYITRSKRKTRNRQTTTKKKNPAEQVDQMDEALKPFFTKSYKRSSSQNSYGASQQYQLSMASQPSQSSQASSQQHSQASSSQTPRKIQVNKFYKSVVKEFEIKKYRQLVDVDKLDRSNIQTMRESSGRPIVTNFAHMGELAWPKDQTMLILNEDKQLDHRAAENESVLFCNKLNLAPSKVLFPRGQASLFNSFSTTVADTLEVSEWIIQGQNKPRYLEELMLLADILIPERPLLKPVPDNNSGVSYIVVGLNDEVSENWHIQHRDHTTKFDYSQDAELIPFDALKSQLQVGRLEEHTLAKWGSKSLLADQPYSSEERKAASHILEQSKENSQFYEVYYSKQQKLIDIVCQADSSSSTHTHSLISSDYVPIPEKEDKNTVDSGEFLNALQWLLGGDNENALFCQNGEQLLSLFLGCSTLYRSREAHEQGFLISKKLLRLWLNQHCFPIHVLNDIPLFAFVDASKENFFYAFLQRCVYLSPAICALWQTPRASPAQTICKLMAQLILHRVKASSLKYLVHIVKVRTEQKREQHHYKTAMLRNNSDEIPLPELQLMDVNFVWCKANNPNLLDPEIICLEIYAIVTKPNHTVKASTFSNWSQSRLDWLDHTQRQGRFSIVPGYLSSAVQEHEGLLKREEFRELLTSVVAAQMLKTMVKVDKTLRAQDLSNANYQNIMNVFNKQIGSALPYNTIRHSADLVTHEFGVPIKAIDYQQDDTSAQGLQAFVEVSFGIEKIPVFATSPRYQDLLSTLSLAMTFDVTLEPTIKSWLLAFFSELTPEQKTTLFEEAGELEATVEQPVEENGFSSSNWLGAPMTEAYASNRITKLLQSPNACLSGETIFKFLKVVLAQCFKGFTFNLRWTENCGKKVSIKPQDGADISLLHMDGCWYLEFDGDLQQKGNTNVVGKLILENELQKFNDIVFDEKLLPTTVAQDKKKSFNTCSQLLGECIKSWNKIQNYCMRRLLCEKECAVELSDLVRRLLLYHLWQFSMGVFFLPYQACVAFDFEESASSQSDEEKFKNHKYISSLLDESKAALSNLKQAEGPHKDSQFFKVFISNLENIWHRNLKENVALCDMKKGLKKLKQNCEDCCDDGTGPSPVQIFVLMFFDKDIPTDFVRQVQFWKQRACLNGLHLIFSHLQATPWTIDGGIWREESKEKGKFLKTCIGQFSKLSKELDHTKQPNIGAFNDQFKACLNKFFADYFTKEDNQSDSCPCCSADTGVRQPTESIVQLMTLHWQINTLEGVATVLLSAPDNRSTANQIAEVTAELEESKIQLISQENNLAIPWKAFTVAKIDK